MKDAGVTNANANSVGWVDDGNGTYGHVNFNENYYKTAGTNWAPEIRITRAQINEMSEACGLNRDNQTIGTRQTTYHKIECSLGNITDSQGTQRSRSANMFGPMPGSGTVVIYHVNWNHHHSINVHNLFAVGIFNATTVQSVEKTVTDNEDRIGEKDIDVRLSFNQGDYVQIYAHIHSSDSEGSGVADYRLEYNIYG